MRRRALPVACGLAQALGGARQVLDADARERRREGVLGLPERGDHHLAEQVRIADRHLLLSLLGAAGRAQDVVGGDAALLAGELVAAARAADAPEDAVAHQGLEHGLEMPRWQ